MTTCGKINGVIYKEIINVTIHILYLELVRFKLKKFHYLIKKAEVDANIHNHLPLIIHWPSVIICTYDFLSSE